ncbi:MAG: glycosyltransferase involved in cell wall biosynthesis [Candidatus Azotimanducaceae bacterium]|jgi:glycosyltransferase involved in cell wall biosynthesis
MKRDIGTFLLYMRILLLSPYDAMSHRYWHEGLVNYCSGHDFTVVTLPARYFSWRFRGNSLSLAFDVRLTGPWDLILATSMTDLSALVGMRPELAACRRLLYFHENQFAYPAVGDPNHRVERQITSLYAALGADQLIFNSAFNRSSFLTGVETLLARLPDEVPVGIVEKLRQLSTLQPVPLYADCFDVIPQRSIDNSRLAIVWNHRWEYDKGVDALQMLVTAMLASDLDFEFHLIGQSFRSVPPALQQVKEMLELAGRLGVCGFIPTRAHYLALLGRSHVVLSTAIHEFQGIAVLEAVAVGCLPVVPDALAYQDFIPACWRYDNSQQALLMLETLGRQLAEQALPVAPSVTDLAWSQQQDHWEALLTGR